MAIDSRTKRESALLDISGMIHPDGAFSVFERAAMIGQYFIEALTGMGGITVNLYVEMSKSVTANLERSKTVNSYVEQTRSVSLGAL